MALLFSLVRKKCVILIKKPAQARAGLWRWGDSNSRVEWIHDHVYILIHLLKPHEMTTSDKHIYRKAFSKSQAKGRKRPSPSSYQEYYDELRPPGPNLSHRQNHLLGD